ncbi:MAG: sulfur carrier protein ThiS [Muribaculaceae bacterium]|nr:sulfur carrier protein ThiS [Muribaculaceae bacterium]
MKITINNKELTVTENATLKEALDMAGIQESGIATAINGSVVPASSRVSHILHEADKIVIIKAFYGG